MNVSPGAVTAPFPPPRGAQPSPPACLPASSLSSGAGRGRLWTTRTPYRPAVGPTSTFMTKRPHPGLGTHWGQALRR
jgi:hypothetical protein